MVMYNMKNIGKSISSYRKNLGMTQEELAEKLHISAQAVSKWENGIGYPDITLVPAISEALNISLNDLFGASDDIDTEEIPSEYEDLNFVISNEKAAIYSDKKVSETGDDGTVVFSDGSTADLNTMTAVNRGTGEIRIYNIDDIIERKLRKKSSDGKCSGVYDDIKSISLSLAYNCDVTISKATDGKTSFEAVGTDTFRSLFSVEALGETLKFKVKSPDRKSNSHNENKITIKTGFSVGEELCVSVCGSNDVRCDVDFDSASLKVTGSGDITAPNFKTCNASIVGSGDITVSEVSEMLKVGITGSGDFSCSRANNPKLTVTGSGDIDVKDISGDALASITGAGDIKIGGNVHSIGIGITGSGGISASKLTTENANIRTDGACNITIGRIIKSSEEKISKFSTLKVLKRG